MDTSAEENEGELLEDVVIGDVNAPQFMIQRLPENAQLLGSELLQHHNGLVVDLVNSDFIPVSYSSAENLLAHDLTDEDRNLAAALVAVQMSQQQKQQHLQDAALQALDSKMLEDQQLIHITDKEALSNGGIFQIVGSNNIYLEKPKMPKLVPAVMKTPPTYTTAQIIEKSEDDEKKASDEENKTEPRTSRKSLLPHKKRISRKLKKPARFPCTLCDQVFTSSEELEDHELQCTTTITPVTAPSFACQLCNAPFEDQLSFFEHLKSHYETPKPAAISSPQKQREKAQEEEDREDRPPPSPPSQVVEKIDPDAGEKDAMFSTLLNLTCIQCNKTFRRQKAFESHMRETHQKKEPDLDEFSEAEDLMDGISVVVDNDNDADSDADNKAWYKEEELHQTEEDLKELEASEHVCHICKQPFPLRAILLQHLVTCRADTGNTEPTARSVVKKKNIKKKNSLQCSECERSFMHRNSLVYHMRSHTGIRPHQCDQCGKSFFASSALKVHLRLHSGDKPYTCEECGKKFRQWGDLKYHMTSLHSNEKQFQCEYCGKDFARKYSLVVHRRIHTGEKNYKCEFCGKTFRAASYLQNHRRIHTGEKPHECEVCGKPFRVRSDMKRHRKTHTKRTTGGTSKVRFGTQETASRKKIKVDTTEEIYQLSLGEEENSGEILGYEQDPEAAVREGNGTLYVMISSSH